MGKRAVRAKSGKAEARAGAGAGAGQSPRGGSPAVLHLLSDSTGNLPRHMLRAFLTQFPEDAFVVREWTFLRSGEALKAALREAAQAGGMVFHAVVSPEHKRRIVDGCRAAKLACCDLTGNFVEFLARESGIQPVADPERLHQFDHAYRRRIEAIEFATQHDDGLGLSTLHEGDLVLAGVSRTSKTPTTIYLAQLGYRAGNVSLALGVEPPREVLAMDPKKVVGLLIDPRMLVEIRTHRQHEWQMGAARYNDPDTVEREVQWSRRLFVKQGWRTLDITGRAIEETAARVVQMMGLSERGG